MCERLYETALKICCMEMFYRKKVIEPARLLVLWVRTEIGLPSFSTLWGSLGDKLDLQFYILVGQHIKCLKLFAGHNMSVC